MFNIMAMKYIIYMQYWKLFESILIPINYLHDVKVSIKSLPFNRLTYLNLLYKV